MFRFIAFIVCTIVCFAQSPADLFNRPPADVDQALRARIQQFYQAHVDGKPRQAEALVAEETKDFFYNGNKPKYLSFEIVGIEYSENFTRAKATVKVEQYVVMPGFGGVLKVPTPSYWKIENGQWYWYVDKPGAEEESPFGGPMKAGPGAGANALPPIPDGRQVLNSLSSRIKLDKRAIHLKPGATDQVTISNTAEGALSISISGSVSGVDVKLDHMDIKPGEKAVLSFRAGNNPQPGTVTIRVEQTNQIFPIQVTID